MNKVELDFTDALEGISNLADYLLELEGKIQSYEIEPLPEEEQGIISEIRLSLEAITADVINNLLKIKGILKYTDDCDFEEIQYWYEDIIENGSRGYYEILKKTKEKHPEFGKIEVETKI